MFDGLTGAALATTNYDPPRGVAVECRWGDSYGNRVDRFLAGVAYLDGVRPSLVMCRGYYTRTVLTAWDWRDGQLTRRWSFDSDRPGNGAYVGQGNHHLSVADVDGDGRDEIVYGACSIDDDGTGLYTTGLGHGDALHLSDMDPDRPGLEVWDVHESPSEAGAGEFRDAGTGAVDLRATRKRGYRSRAGRPHRCPLPGYQMWSSASGGAYDRDGGRDLRHDPLHQFCGLVGRGPAARIAGQRGQRRGQPQAGQVDGQRHHPHPQSLLRGRRRQKQQRDQVQSCLSGDLLGDWREEMLFRSADSGQLMLFVTPHPATNRFRTFLHDAQYRLALAWQNVAYNQPPHPEFLRGRRHGRPAPALDLGRRPGLGGRWHRQCLGCGDHRELAHRRGLDLRLLLPPFSRPNGVVRPDRHQRPRGHPPGHAHTDGR